MFYAFPAVLATRCKRIVMPTIRKIEIKNFRSVRSLIWHPNRGFNCLIGPGDAGKSTILDAIDLCLGARRNLNFSDTDFFDLDVENPIKISILLGDLEDALKSLDAYSDFLRGFDPDDYSLYEEPSDAAGLETVLLIELVVDKDLEPSWALQSARGDAKGFERNFKWSDRERLAPLRLGTYGDQHFSWKRGAILNKLSEETPDAKSVISNAAREARDLFGDTANVQMADAIKLTNQTANALGVDVGGSAKAMLDIHSVSLGSGSVSLHNAAGVPIRGLGTGSKRLLLAGLQREASEQHSIVLVDEIELGLEPHRVTRFLKSLGSKDQDEGLQVFATSHAPTVLQELDCSQISIVRKAEETEVLAVPSEAQGNVRAYPHALLSKTILICEGKTEIGFVRGIDLFRVQVNQKEALDTYGLALVDCDGGDEKRPFERAKVFQDLGYKVGVFIDNDRSLPEKEINEFKSSGGDLFCWADGYSIEDAIFRSATQSVLLETLKTAEELNDGDWLMSKVASASVGALTFNDAKDYAKIEVLSEEQIGFLASASGGKRGWFKDIDRMEFLARNVIAPNFKSFDSNFRRVVSDILRWATT